jgi:RNA polymerase sigma-70 factor (ECF subfamily)
LGGITLNISIELFLAQIEKKAYRMAEIATQNPADALDIVQETMIKLVQKYSDKPSEQWKPLFYRILQNRITDHFRSRTIHRKVFFWKNSQQDDEQFEDNILKASDFITPEREVTGRRNIESVIDSLKSLPRRQQQCFMLRSWEGFSVKETAKAMGCSEGSVKTHYSRARESLRKSLNEELF